MSSRIWKCFSKDTLWASLLHILWALWSSSLLNMDQCSGEVLWRTCQEAGPVSDEKRSKSGKALTFLPSCCIFFNAWITLTLLNLSANLGSKWMLAQIQIFFPNGNNRLRDCIQYVSSSGSFSKMRSCRNLWYRSCSFYRNMYLLTLETSRTKVRLSFADIPHKLLWHGNKLSCFVPTCFYASMNIFLLCSEPAGK